MLTYLIARLKLKMNRTESELERINQYRKNKHLVVEREKWTMQTEFKQPNVTNFHFINYDPDLGLTDLSNLSFKVDPSKDTAIVSIPLSFTERTQTKLVSHDDLTRGFDVQAYMAPHSTSSYPH